MTKGCSNFDAVCMLLVLFGGPALFFYDLAHPELWGDWQHDPRVYGLPCIVLILVIVPVLCLLVRKQRHNERSVSQNLRLITMSKVIKALFRNGRCKEGLEADQLYKRIKAARAKAEEDTLAKQFFDTYGVYTERK